MDPVKSHINGMTAGRDLAKYETVTDLVGDDDPLGIEVPARVDRIVGAPIAAGDTLVIGADGRVYPTGAPQVPTTPEELVQALCDDIAEAYPMVVGWEIFEEGQEVRLRLPHGIRGAVSLSDLNTSVWRSVIARRFARAVWEKDQERIVVESVESQPDDPELHG